MKVTMNFLVQITHFKADYINLFIKDPCSPTLVICHVVRQPCDTDVHITYHLSHKGFCYQTVIIGYLLIYINSLGGL